MNTVTNIDFFSVLKSKDEKLLSILDLSDAIFLYTNVEGNVEFINSSGSKILGFPKKEIIGKNWIDNFIPENFKEEITQKSEIFLSGNTKILEENENLILTKSLNERLIYWHNSLIYDESQNIAGILSSGLDVTEKKNNDNVQRVIREILQASNSESDINEFFKLIHSSVKELMPAENFYIALHNKGENIISFPYFVDQVEKIAPHKRLGRGLTEYVLRSGKSILVNRKMDEELVSKGEVDLIGEPTKIWLGIPLKIQESTIGVLVVQDYNNEKTYGNPEKEILEVISFAISRSIERKRVEQEKNELIEKLRYLNSTKDKLISIISHDLRSPFNSLLGFSEILITEFDTLTHDEILEYLKVIYDSSKSLFNMTNNLLQYSRIQLGRIDFNPKKINLNKLVKSCINLFKGNALKKQINLMLNIDNNINVSADEDMLNSIIQNLVSNGIKFTKKGGDLKVFAEEIYNENEEKRINICIEDNGVGIYERDIKNIYNNKINSTPGTDKEYGTGLGLLLVKEFLERNSSKLLIKSKVNSGSTFSFTLPLYDES